MKITSSRVKSAFVCGLASAVTALAASAASVVEVPVGATTEEIMAAVVSVEEGGTIRFGAGTWTVTNTVVLAKGVTVEGAGPAATVLDCRANPEIGKFIMFFHCTKVPEVENFYTHCSIGIAWSDDLKTWSWPGK